MRKWTLEERLAQAQLIRLQKPWTYSTGPKTQEGKAMSCRNSYKHGARRSDVRTLSKKISQFKRELVNILEFL
ncbi:hypothetical protein TUM19329_02770 [Legionella antarctica]|uniref:Uncharacterized protein n=1 Tax=Legionella antarctica TaxID=2708020 RepID=A0A6F8T1P5_9GAMM|nr:hypothetical protein TUM19329_02770 [Legionella antarctica]